MVVKPLRTFLSFLFPLLVYFQPDIFFMITFFLLLFAHTKLKSVRKISRKTCGNKDWFIVFPIPARNFLRGNFLFSCRWREDSIDEWKKKLPSNFFFFFFLDSQELEIFFSYEKCASPLHHLLCEVATNEFTRERGEKCQNFHTFRPNSLLLQVRHAQVTALRCGFHSHCYSPLDTPPPTSTLPPLFPYLPLLCSPPLL